ncbi:MAG: orotidine-5'-phosphate decarboxylase [Coraliomargaritaceae bacterium]
MNQQKQTELILALDCEDRKSALDLIKPLQGHLKWVKIGLQMFTAYGLPFVHEIKSMGYNVFLDLKLHDIPNTVAKAILSLSSASIDLLTIHASGGSEMCAYAVKARDESNPNLKLLAVTVLTSMNQQQMEALNVNKPVQDHVLDLAKISVDANVDGIVSSTHELKLLRETLGNDPLIVTPGIRPKGADLNEQKRVMTPSDAKELGADYIVVGRPIYKSEDPLESVKSILEDIR